MTPVPTRPVALLVAVAFFMENLDGTIIAPAAPAIGVSLGVQAVDINLAITAYLLTVAVFIPVSGWIADRYGARRVFCSALVVFTVASVLCAAAQTLPELVLTRVLQGLGGAMMVPVGRLVVLRVTPKSDLIAAIAYLTWPALVSPVIAPAVGGLLAQHASWRWIFLVNVPVGIIALLLALRLIPALAQPPPPPLDRLGFILTGAGLASLLGGLEWAGDPDRLVLAGAVLAAGAGLGAIAVVHLRRAEHPLLDLSTLRIRTFRVANTGGTAFRVAISAVPFLVPLLLQQAFGWTPSEAGLGVLALFAGNLAIKPFTTPLLRGLGFRTVLVGNGLAGVGVLVAIGLLGPGTPLWLLVAVLFASGVFRSISFTAYNTITFADVPAEATSSANAFSSAAFQLSIGLGVAVGALLLRVGGQLFPEAGVEAAYRFAFVALALLAATAVLESLRLPRDAGSAVSGKVPA